MLLWYVDQKGYYGREDICICVYIYFDTVSKGTQYIDVIYCNHFYNVIECYFNIFFLWKFHMNYVIFSIDFF